MDKIVRAEVIYDDGNVHIIDFVIDDFVKLSNNTTLIIEEGADNMNLPPLSRQKLGCIKCIFTEPIVGLILPSVL